MQEALGQKPHKEVEWQHRLARFVASGQQVKEFCRVEQVSAATFYRWRRQLGGPVDTSAQTASFIDIGALPPACAARAVSQGDSGDAALEVRLDLGHGLVLHIVRR